MALQYPVPIPHGAIDLKPAPSEFQRSFANTVGNAATNRDGFETLIAPTAAHLANSRAFLTGFDSDLRAIGALPAELDGRFHRDFENSLAATIKAGQADFDKFDVHLTGKNPPATQPSGPPTQGGGGLQPVAFGTLPQGAAAKSIAVPFTNPFNFVVHPTGVKIEQGHLQVFVAVSECGAAIPANGTCKIVVTFRPLLAGHYAGLLVFTTDDPNSPYTLGINGTVAPPGSGGVGGGGVGGGGGGGLGGHPITKGGE
jgi:hypothetical protein